MLGFDSGIKPGSSDGKIIGTVFLNVDGIILGIDIGTDMGSLDVFFDGFNYVELDNLLLGGSMGYTDIKMIASDVGIRLG